MKGSRSVYDIDDETSSTEPGGENRQTSVSFGFLCAVSPAPFPGEKKKL
jgi:hypothetical protein